MDPARSIIEALAENIVLGELTVEGIGKSARSVLGRRYAFVPELALRILKAFGAGKRPRLFRLKKFLLADERLQQALRKRSFPQWRRPAPKPLMLPSRGAPQEWKMPSLTTPGEVAQWLGVPWSELLWLADARQWETGAPEGPLRHYRRRWISKRDGKARLVESPKLRLKTLQRRILHEILDRVPPHEAAHGFCRGRSIVTFAAPHAGQALVLRVDLRDFFPNIPRWRITGLLMAAGYPEPVAMLLSNLCTTSTPQEILLGCPAEMPLDQRWWHRKLYQRPHLPQGAPTSPALANLCAFRLDCRLTGLARARGAVYTRYADDLVFSGGPEFAGGAGWFLNQAAAIVREEGFQIQPRKTRFMEQSTRQNAAGVILNSHPNVRRDDFDKLKAVLHNCACYGPDGQNRESVPDFRAYLAGRIGHVDMINPTRGQKLREVFDRIVW